MRINSCRNLTRIIITLLFMLLSTNAFLFAQEIDAISTGNQGSVHAKKSSRQSITSAQEDKNLSVMQKQARTYRDQGLELQRSGNLEAALSLYQKAAEIDPGYAVVYNDLGIIYEANGLIERAEESYLKCIKIDPSYLSAYTNLALLYENKRDLERAAFYWGKRAELGSPDDPWTEKARLRLKDIRAVSSDRPLQDLKEQEVVGLLKSVTVQKSVLKKDNKSIARDYFEKAKLKFKKQDEVTALKIAIDALQLDPANTEIQEFIDRVQLRVLSR